MAENSNPTMPDAPDYTMVLPVRHYRVDAQRVAVESAFAGHLRMLRARLGTAARKLVIASPGMAEAAYEAGKKSFAVLDEPQEQIEFVTLFRDDEAQSVKAKIRLMKPVMQSLIKLVQRSFCIHSGLSWDVWLPFEFTSIMMGWLHGKKTVFVVDIDYRKSAWMSYRSGDWSHRSYLMSKYVYDPARSLQVAAATEWCSLVLLKGRKMAEDFGRQRANVKAFLDASHSEKNMIDAGNLQRKLTSLLNPAQPLRLVYFGRLTAYKGIDRCLHAVASARQAGANVTLDVIGGGDQLEALQNLARELSVQEYVTFHGPLPFNQEFFRTLYPFHLLLAAPLREDTPRSALDAMAAGIPFLAFDTYYYRELMESGSGRVVPWPDADAMARELARLAGNRDEVAAMAEKAVVFARENTQEIWLERRMEWTMESALRE